MTTVTETYWKDNKELILSYCSLFPTPFGRALSRTGITQEELESTTDIEDVMEFCQNMWEELPDDRTIHKAGFNQLCFLAFLNQLVFYTA